MWHLFFKEPTFLGYYHSAASIYIIFDLKVPLSQLSRYATKYPEISVLDLGQFAGIDSTFTSPRMNFFRADAHTPYVLHYKSFPCKGMGIIKMCALSADLKFLSAPRLKHSATYTNHQDYIKKKKGWGKHTDYTFISIIFIYI